jgi:secreted trypsin-like serine protease
MRTRLSRLTTLVAVLALVLLTIAPASAVTNGELDGDDHPAVVLILMEVGGAPAFRCSGTLISPTYVLTAGHCTNNFPGDPYTGMRVFTESDVESGIGVTNNYPFAGPNAVEAKRWAAHPAYETAPFFVNDVGIIELEEAIVLDASDYGQLPAINSLDALKGGKKDFFDSVGYGLQAAQLNNPTPQQHTVAQRVRMISHPKLIQINTPGFVGSFSMLLSNNTKTGGTCFGDSGGPNFLAGTNVLAGVTSFGLNANCGGTGGVFRTDRQNVQDFISDFIAAG